MLLLFEFLQLHGFGEFCKYNERIHKILSDFPSYSLRAYTWRLEIGHSRLGGQSSQKKIVG